MKTLPRLCLLVCLVGACPLAGQTDPFEYFGQLFAKPQEQKAPALDPKRIINASNSFLKEREPEMTAEEYALYERVIDMIASSPEFALRMLEGMMAGAEAPSPAFEFILGNVYFAADQSEKAEKSFRGAVNRYPTFLRAWNNLGVLYYSNNRFAEAVECLSKSVVLGDRDPATFGLLGFCLEKQGNTVSAEMAYMQALSGDPDNADWMEGLLRLYITGSQFGRAESLARTLVKKRPAESRYWLAHAHVLIALDRKVEAAVLLETAAGMGIAGPDELVLLGDLYVEQSLATEAVAVYAKVLGPARDRGEQKLLQFARILIAVGNLEEAERALVAVDETPSAAGRLAILQARADLLMARKRWAEARAEAEALLKLAPLDGPALLTVGRTYVQENDPARAAFAFEAAFRIPGTTYRASLELASLELRARHYAKAVEYLEKALSIQESDTVRDYLARVRMLVGPDPASSG